MSASPIRRCSRWVAVLALIIGAIDLRAKPLPVPFNSEYHAEIWGLEDGFPENSCSGVVEAPDGYLWLGTFRGLVRFNGQEFKSWAPASLPLLQSTTIIAMYRDSQRRIWFSTSEGLIVNQGSSWKQFTEADGWTERSDFVRSFAEDRHGNLVFGRFSGRMLRLEGSRFVPLPDTPRGGGGALCAFDRSGGLYVVRGGFAGQLEGDEWKTISNDAGFEDRLLGAAQDRNGNAIIVCRNELLRLHEGRVETSLALSQPVGTFWRMTEDIAGNLWLAAVESGVYRIRPDGTVKHFQKADGLPQSGGTRIVYADASGSIWIGSGVGGFTRFRPTRFRYLGEQEGVGDREIPALTPLGDGRVLIASYGGGLLRFDGVRAVSPVRLAEPGVEYFRTVLRTRDQQIWVGIFNRGLQRLDDTELKPEATDIFGPRETVKTLFEDSQGRLWAGSDQHVAVRERGAFRDIGGTSVPRDRFPTFFAERKDGTILLACGNQVFAYGTDGLRAAPLVTLPADMRISSTAVDTHDRLWIGTQGHGLNVFFNDELLAVDPSYGLPKGMISALIQDDLGALWMGAGRNVVRCDPDDLWAMAENAEARATVQLFDQSDGLRDLDFPFGSQPSVAKDERGHLWFAMIRGAATVDPATLRVNDRAPRVVVERLSFVPEGAAKPVEISLAELQQIPVLPAGSRLIRISYAALDFLAPRKQRFRVRLGDESGQWQEMNRETVVSFLELPPGRHTLHIQAAGNDGTWSSPGATMAFELAPYFWQTTWFRGVIGLALVSLVGSAAWFAADRRTKTANEKLERERSLAEAQARLALVLENTSDFVAFADSSEFLVYVNRAGRGLVGLAPAADIRTLQTSSILPAWARADFARDVLPVALRDGTWSGESALLHRDGHEIPVSLVVLAHRAPGGGLDFTSMIARDISAAKRHSMVQDALRGLATSLTAALEPRSLGATVAEACRKLFGHDAFFLVLLNPRGDVTLGAYMEDTDRGGSHPREVPPSIHSLSPQMRPVLQGAPLLVNRVDESKQGIADAFEPWGHTARRSLSIMHAPVLWESGVVGIVSVQSYTARRYGQHDLEQLQTLADHCGAAIARMNAEASLRQNEERLRLAMRTARMGSWEIDVTHHSLLASPEAEDVYGYVRGTLSGPVSNLAARVLEPEDAELRTLLDRLLQGQIAEIDHAHRIIFADGSERWLELKGHRQQHPDSSGPPRIIGVTSDITSRRLAEQERIRLEEQLRQSQKLEAIGTLAGGIAHDFNNILTAILSNTELGMIDTEQGHPARESFEKIKKSGQRARDLVRRILSFSRPVDAQRQPTALQPVVEEVVKLLRSTIPANVEISVHCTAVPLVDLDSTELHQVLLNLGTNAWHALGSRPGRIRFAVEPENITTARANLLPDLKPGRYVRLVVSDNGRGIPPELLPRIFDPFFTTKSPGEGTGLGLSVVHGIVRANGGAITVSSVVGAGTTFELFFPESQATRPVPPTTVSPAPTVARVGQGEAILFVDDEEALIMVADRVLGRAGYAVTTFLRPRKALEHFRAHVDSIRLVVSDLSMPEMSGLELAREMLQIRPDLPIILTSGYLRAGEADTARAIGVREIVEKPNTPHDLLPIVARLLKNSSPPEARVPTSPSAAG